MRCVAVYEVEVCCVFLFKQKTAYERRISDWSSDVCSSDLLKVIDDVVEIQLIQVRHRRGVTKGQAVQVGIHRGCAERHLAAPPAIFDFAGVDRTSVGSGKSVSVRVDLGGRRIIKNKRKTVHKQHSINETPSTAQTIT